MLKIILVRHGHSTSNASGTYTGQMDAPLSEIGYAQAVQLADCLCTSYQIDAIFTSDLSRAVQTTHPTAERLGLTPRHARELRELDTGVWTGMPYAEVHERYAADFNAYTKSVDAPCTGGESIRTASSRLLTYIEQIAQAWDGKTVLICSHALCCRLFASLADTGRIEDVTAHPAPPNASFSVYEYENGAVRPLLQHQTAHLENVTSLAVRGLV